MKKHTQRICSDSFYLVYNSGNNREKLFYNNKNFQYFLDNYFDYLSDFVDTYAYNLIPNEFNILIKTPVEADEISNQFRKFFISYANSINIQENRIGSLFLKPFRRKPLVGINYIQREIFYIHYKPVHLKLSRRYENYFWSSYNSILSNAKTKICRDKVLKLFGEHDEFIQFHKYMLDFDLTNFQFHDEKKHQLYRNKIFKY